MRGPWDEPGHGCRSDDEAERGRHRMQRSMAFDGGLERKAFELGQIDREQRTQRQDGEQRQSTMGKIHAAKQEVNAVIALRD
jgi:hypothetical protein